MSLGYASANFSGPLIAGVLIDNLGQARTFASLALPLIPAIVLAAMGSRWIPNGHAKSEAVKDGLFELLKIKTLRNTRQIGDPAIQRRYLPNHANTFFQLFSALRARYCARPTVKNACIGTTYL